MTPEPEPPSPPPDLDKLVQALRQVAEGLQTALNGLLEVIELLEE